MCFDLPACRRSDAVSRLLLVLPQCRPVALDAAASSAAVVAAYQSGQAQYDMLVLDDGGAGALSVECATAESAIVLSTPADGCEHVDGTAHYIVADGVQHTLTAAARPPSPSTPPPAAPPAAPPPSRRARSTTRPSPRRACCPSRRTRPTARCSPR